MARILLIDDDESFRKMLRLTLVKMGHDVVEAAHGKAGAKLFREKPADLVMTDLVMPEQEGLETIQEFRRAYPAVKLVAMSGGSRNLNAKDMLVIAKLFGAERTLTKPFSNQQLGEALTALLPQG